MTRILLLLLASLVATGADDPWEKVKELKSGSDLKIWKGGASQPVEAKYDDLTGEKLLVVLKNEQAAIDKDAIDRIDARASSKRSKPTVENKVTRDVELSDRPAAPPRSMKESQPGGPSMSSSSSVSWGGKPGFETVYRRTAAAKQ